MEIKIFTDEYFMKEALKEADKALQEGEVPVGAIIVSDKKVIARAHNQVEKLTDVTAHAEMIAITSAANYLGGKYLKECTLYVTVEPCLMCATAIMWAQMGKLVYGASDEKKGFTNMKQKVLHPKTKLRGRLLEKECGEKMTGFFQDKRGGRGKVNG